jgi:HSP20 family protein
MRRRYFDPFSEMRRLLDSIERAFEDLWPEPVYDFEKGFREIYREPYVDVFETDKEVVVTVELPGVRKEDIDLTVREDSVEIKAEIKREEEKKEESGYQHRKMFQKYYTVIPLPCEVVPEKTRATYNNGVLEIRIPKAEVSKGTKVKVE